MSYADRIAASEAAAGAELTPEETKVRDALVHALDLAKLHGITFLAFVQLSKAPGGKGMFAVGQGSTGDLTSMCAKMVKKMFLHDLGQKMPGDYSETVEVDLSKGGGHPMCIKKSPITYGQAVFFCGELEKLLTNFEIGITPRVKLEVRFSCIADAYRDALQRKSQPEVLEYLNDKYRRAVSLFDGWLTGEIDSETIGRGTHQVLPAIGDQGGAHG